MVRQAFQTFSKSSNPLVQEFLAAVNNETTQQESSLCSFLLDVNDMLSEVDSEQQMERLRTLDDDSREAAWQTLLAISNSSSNGTQNSSVADVMARFGCNNPVRHEYINGFWGDYYFFDPSVDMSNVSLSELDPDFSNVENTIDFLTLDDFLDGHNEYKDKRIAAVWVGSIRIYVSGDYQFTVMSSNFSTFSIDGVSLINNTGFSGIHEENAGIFLDSGYHDIKLEFYQTDKPTTMILTYQGPDTLDKDSLLRGFHLEQVKELFHDYVAKRSRSIYSAAKPVGAQPKSTLRSRLSTRPTRRVRHSDQAAVKPTGLAWPTPQNRALTHNLSPLLHLISSAKGKSSSNPIENRAPNRVKTEEKMKQLKELQSEAAMYGLKLQRKHQQHTARAIIRRSSISQLPIKDVSSTN